MYQKEKSVAFTGHRSEKLPRGAEAQQQFLADLQSEILTAVDNGYTTFFTGMSYGFDLIAGDIVLRMKKEYPVQLVAAVPFRSQAQKYSKENFDEYQRILSLCDNVHLGSEHYYSGIYYDRNRFMVDKSSLLIAYSNGSGGSQYTVDYAHKTGISVINLF